MEQENVEQEIEPKPLIKKFESWMIPALCLHLEEGCSFNSFPGRYRIDLKLWNEWARTNPQLVMANTIYKNRKIAEKRKTL